MIPPGFDLILPQPGANRPGRDIFHDVLLDGDLRQFFPRPARPGFAVGTGRTTGQRDNLVRCNDVKVRRVPARGASRTLSVCCQRCRQCLTVWIQQPTLPGDLDIPPGGMLMSEQKYPRALNFRKRGRVTGAELLQKLALAPV